MKRILFLSPTLCTFNCDAILLQVPIILIGFAALGGATIAPEASAWIAVFILPLNSAINPVLYTMSAIDCGRCVTSSTFCVYSLLLFVVRKKKLNF